MKLTADREAYLEQRIYEIRTEFATEGTQRRAFGRSCGSKEERQAYCKKHGILGKDMEVILNIHRRK